MIMNDIEVKDVTIEIPGMNWPSWETMVNVALEESAGVMEYEVSHIRRQARVKFDLSQTNEEKLMDNIKKKTRYRELSVKE